MMHWIFYCFMIFFSSSCNTQSEKKDLEKLSEETEKSYPEAHEEAKHLQKKVDELNIDVQQEAEKRIQKIEEKIQDNSPDTP